MRTLTIQTPDHVDVEGILRFSSDRSGCAAWEVEVRHRWSITPSARLLRHIAPGHRRCHSQDQPLGTVNANLLAVDEAAGAIDSRHHGWDAILTRHDGRVGRRPTAVYHHCAGPLEERRPGRVRVGGD